MRTKDREKARRGVVLLWALITLAVTTTILGAIGSYYASSMRIGLQYLQKNQQYYTFMKASSSFNNQLEQTIANINETIAQKAKTNVTLGGKSDAVKTLVDGLQGLVTTSITEGDYRVDFKMEGLETVESVIVAKGEVSLTITASIWVKGAGGSWSQLMTFEEDLIVALETTDTLTNCAIFDYVYFANNYGHLDSPYSAKIIANGNVGANDIFTIKGATINGYVWAHGTSDNDDLAVNLESSPHIWPYDLYHKKIVNEYQEAVGDAGTTEQFYMPVRPTNPIYYGTSYIDWPGGYEYPAAISKYGTIAADGTAALVAYSTVEPTCTVDLDNPVANPGSEPEPQSMPDIDDYTTWWWWYEEVDYSGYSEALQTWYENYGGTTNDPPPDYNDTSGDWYTKRTKKGKVTYEFNESKYESALNTWSNRQNKDGTVPQAILDAWQANYTSYTNYVHATNTYWTEWNTWNADKQQWETDQETWKNSFSSDEGIALEKTTVHQYPDTGVLKYIVTTSTNVITMPNLSDDDGYRQYCQDYVCTNGVKGGTLVCANRYKVTGSTSYKNIAYSFVFNDAIEYEYAYKSHVRTNFEKGHIFPETNYTSTATTKTRTLAYVQVVGGYKQNIYPFASRPNEQEQNESDGSDTYYSKTEDITAAEAAQLKVSERGSVILIGTANFPITISGPVYFDGDVIIRGFVSGQGTIYAGRNIHIIGDLTYLNPPSWPHSTTDMNSNTPDVVKASNAAKDMLMLAARGNIIVGDYSSDDWQTACKQYMKITSWSSNTFCSDYADDDIGYSSFAHDYTAKEGAAIDENAVVTVDYSTTRYKQSAYKSLDYDHLYPGTLYACNLNYYRKRPHVVKGNRRYYESILGSDVIKGLMQTDNASGSSESWEWSSTSILRWLFGNEDYDSVADDNHSSSTLDLSAASSAVKADVDAGDITQIDAILFANHGIFGKVGGSTSKKFKLHGALLCRDEGLLPSFAYGDAFKDSSIAQAWINWDMRIKSSSAEAIPGSGAPTDQTASSSKITIRETSWRQKN